MTDQTGIQAPQKRLGRSRNDAFSNANSTANTAFERTEQPSFRGVNTVAKAKTTTGFAQNQYERTLLSLPGMEISGG